jgi:hydroxypyruvate reductase
VLVFGGGNAAAHVAAAIAAIPGDALDGGVVVTDDPTRTETVDVLPADHPTPSQRGVDSTSEMLKRAESVDSDTLVLAVITGGGSACMVAPAEGIGLGDLQATTDTLLNSGASIHEINAIRKHLSAIKGGQFVRTLAPARVTTLILSDVVGDDFDVIASGPLVPDRTSYADALEVVESYDIDLPSAVQKRLESGAKGEIEDTPDSDDPVFDRVSTHLIGTNMTALEAASEVAEERGYSPLILSSRMRGEARDVALAHVAIAEEITETENPLDPPAVVLSGGETTVTVTGEGCGGPNQEFALAAGLELPSKAVLAAVDTDGIDGNTEAAGAILDGGSVADPEAARRALNANETNSYLDEIDALIETGPTGTNVNDLRVLVIGDSD